MNNKPHSQKTKDKISKSKKGNIPWNKGKTNVYSENTLKKMSESHKGLNTWNKDIPRSEKTKKKISESNKGKIQTKKSNLKRSKKLKGKIFSEKTKKLISKNRKNKHKGPDHVRWNNGGLKNHRHIFEGIKRRTWVKKVFKRDNYTCQECGLKNIKLNSHHIIPYRDCYNTSLEDHIMNGITLCKNCHKKTLNKEYNFTYKYFKITRRLINE